MQLAPKEYNMPLAGVTNLTGTELEELCQMIDYDTINTPCIEVADGHYLTWCLGCVCAVRPGSIGPSKCGNKLQKRLYLT